MDKKELWVKAWLTVAGASNCARKSAPADFADRLLEDIEERFPEELKHPENDELIKSGDPKGDVKHKLAIAMSNICSLLYDDSQGVRRVTTNALKECSTDSLVALHTAIGEILDANINTTEEISGRIEKVGIYDFFKRVFENNPDFVMKVQQVTGHLVQQGAQQ